MTAGAEPSQPPGWALFARWHALIDRGDPRFDFVAPLDRVDEPLARISETVAVSLWNMQRHQNIYAMRDAAPLDRRARARGVEIRFIIPRRVAERRSPLSSSFEHNLRIAPVAQPLLICDGRLVIVGDSTGEAVWASTDPGVAGDAISLFESVWERATPAVPPGESPPFTPRMVDIAFRLVDGATDREIARALGVSERTVSSDVREMSRRLGARSRAHAIALISGVEG